MAQLSILGPPRGGRRVKTPQEVIAESAAWPKDDPSIEGVPVVVEPVLPVLPGGVTTPVPSLISSYFRSLGRFNVGGITKQGQDYVFHDLELPMGCWRELVLQGQLFPDGRKSFDDWSKVTQVSQPVGVIPADIRYGLMAVCYLNKAKSGLNSIIQEIHSGVWLPDAKTNFPHNSTMIEYRADDSAIIRPGVGWPADHPFGAPYLANIAGSYSLISDAAVSVAPSVMSALEGLFGEKDQEHCKRVLEWGMGAGPSKLWRGGPRESGKRVVVFGVGGGDAGIHAYDVHYDGKPARAVRAEKIFFEPK